MVLRCPRPSTTTTAVKSLVSTMSRRSTSLPPSRPSKRLRLDPQARRHMTSQDFKDGLFLAPMVRSGALPTRLFALKHGATLVWGPEMVDKAILHADRVVDPITGVVSYNGKTRAMFTTHPLEKPYLIFQIGSADPKLAVEAARAVLADVSGIDLNCGCPKSFSTHAGMGAALLTNPDRLCAILTALRAALPKEVSVSAKIRLLPDQGDTLRLVERIVNCGVSAITVHCRTREMRPREKALVGRLREIVQFVEGLGKGVAVVENGDCTGWDEAKKIRELTGAHSVMIATAAEANPSVFSPKPLVDIERTLVPSYLRLSHYLRNHQTLTKFCVMQFTGAHDVLSKSDLKRVRVSMSQAKTWDDWAELAGDWDEDWRELEEVREALEARGGFERMTFVPPTPPADSDGSDTETETEPTMFCTPTERPILQPPGAPGPFGSTYGRWSRRIPAGVSGRDEVTPSPMSEAERAEAARMSLWHDGCMRLDP